MHLLKINTIANASPSVGEYLYSAWFNTLEANITGFSIPSISCETIPPIP
jgi:hypothetical protein